LAAKYAPATTNQALAALRGVLKECWRLEVMSAEDYQRAADLPPAKGEQIPAGREVTKAEVVSLAREDFNPETGTLRVLHGKGGKQRIVYVTNGAIAALKAWLEVRGDRNGPLLCRVTKAGAIVLDADLAPAPITPQAARDALERVRVAAGVAAFAPHDLRRTYAGDLLDDGADLASVQALMGHSSPTTTARYDRRGERSKARAAARPRHEHGHAQVLPHRRPLSPRPDTQHGADPDLRYQPPGSKAARQSRMLTAQCPAARSASVISASVRSAMQAAFHARLLFKRGISARVCRCPCTLTEMGNS